MARRPAFSRRCSVFAIIFVAVHFLEVCNASSSESSHSTHAGGTVEQAVLDELFDWLEKGGAKYVRDGTRNSKVIFYTCMHEVSGDSENLEHIDVEANWMQGLDDRKSDHGDEIVEILSSLDALSCQCRFLVFFDVALQVVVDSPPPLSKRHNRCAPNDSMTHPQERNHAISKYYPSMGSFVPCSDRNPNLHGYREHICRCRFMRNGGLQGHI